MPCIWDLGLLGWATHVVLARVVLHGKTDFPCHCYSRKLDAWWELQPLIDKFLRHRVLLSYQWPCDTPVLPVAKLNGECRMAHDLRVINKAVIPSHSIVTNSELKAASFCILLNLRSKILWIQSFPTNAQISKQELKHLGCILTPRKHALSLMRKKPYCIESHQKQRSS